jgi:hypothetical protein
MGAAKRVELSKRAEAQIAASRKAEPPFEDLEKRLRQEETTRIEVPPPPKNGYERRRPLVATYGADPDLAPAYAEWDAAELAERARRQSAQRGGGPDGLGAVVPDPANSNTSPDGNVSRIEPRFDGGRPARQAAQPDREAAATDNVVHIQDMRAPASPVGPVGVADPAGALATIASATANLRTALAARHEEPLPRMFAGQATAAMPAESATFPDDQFEHAEAYQAVLEPAGEPRVDVTVHERRVTFSVPAESELPGAIGRAAAALASEPAEASGGAPENNDVTVTTALLARPMNAASEGSGQADWRKNEHMDIVL